MKLRMNCWLPSIAMVLLSAQLTSAQTIGPVLLWPKGAPGETNTVSAERDTTGPDGRMVAGKRVIRLGHVSQPSITVYRPKPELDTGAAVVVCPGGGYSILALDLEGTEVCEWLNSIGVTGVLLKYRVPKKANGPLQDAQRAVGLVRQRAKEWGINPQRIGVLGFSAGGNLAAELSANCAEREYPKVDAADEVSCRPDFQILIYPAYLVEKEEPTKIVSNVAVTTNTPPAFLLMTADDPVRAENVLGYALAFKQAKVPVELHVYPTGGHGYGLRRTEEAVTEWPELARKWMQGRGWLERR